MSRQNDEQKFKQRKKTPEHPGGGAPKGRLTTWKPNKEQASYLAEGNMSLEDAVDVLDDFVTSGHVAFTLGWGNKGNALFVIARETGVPYMEAVATSVWHNEMNKAIVTMAYYLTAVNPVFPSEGIITQDDESFW